VADHRNVITVSVSSLQQREIAKNGWKIDGTPVALGWDADGLNIYGREP
jgi:hypothetical protein